MMNSIRLPKIKKKHHNLRECPKCGSFGIKLIEEVKKMSEEKEIKCQFCGKTFNKTDLVVKTETTDIFLGLNWGVPSLSLIHI